MKFIERLTKDYENGRFDCGLTLRVNHRSNGNTYFYFTNDGEMYESFAQTSAALKIFKAFIVSHDIKVDTISKEPMWGDNYRSEHELNPTETPPSFKTTL